MTAGPRSLMIVSEQVDAARRAGIAEGREPRPEYIVLEQDYGVDLHDWSKVPDSGRRSWRLALRHVRSALHRASGYDAILSDGEHVGIPLALAKRATGLRAGHVVIGHHVTVPKKRPFFRVLHAQAGMSKLLLHSRRQMELAAGDLKIDAGRLALVPYAVDARFWSPVRKREERLVLAVGREHRDYATLAEAAGRLPLPVVVAAHSLHSPQATWSAPARWPNNCRVVSVDRAALRDLYGRASIVVVPVLETDFQAGITAILEAMAMARPVVVTGTSGQTDVVVDRVTGLVVPPGDPRRLSEAIFELTCDAGLRQRLGRNAREAVLSAYDVDTYARRLAEQLEAAGRR